MLPPRSKDTMARKKRSEYEREQRQAVASSWTGKGGQTREAVFRRPDGQLSRWRLTPAAGGLVVATRIRADR
jgi:hypothetical protein